MNAWIKAWEDCGDVMRLLGVCMCLYWDRIRDGQGLNKKLVKLNEKPISLM